MMMMMMMMMMMRKLPITPQIWMSPFLPLEVSNKLSTPIERNKARHLRNTQELCAGCNLYLASVL